VRYFETTHTAATAKAPARQGTKCRVQWMQMGYICWHLDSLDDSGGCKCFSVDRWGDTRHRIQLRCILHIDILIILCFEVYLWNELSAVADGWMIFSKKTKVISMRELIEICGLFIQMGRSGIDQGVHHNWYSWCTHVFYPCFLPVPLDIRMTRVLMGGYGWRSEGHPWWAPTISMNDAVHMSIEMIQRLTSRYPPS